MMDKLSFEQLQSKTIDWLRFPLTFLVVLIHMNPSVDMQSVDFFHFKSIDFYTLIASLFSHVVGHLAVPSFFLYSGFYFFYKSQNWNLKIYSQKLKSRFKTLFIPYIVWNLVLVSINAFIQLSNGKENFQSFFISLYEKGIWRIFWNYTSWGENNSNILGEKIPSYGPYLLPLWFLRDLILMVILSYLIYYYLKFTKFWGVLILGFFYFTKIGFVKEGFSTGLFLNALFFFSLGAYFSIHGKNLVVSFRKLERPFLFISILTLILSVIFDKTPYRFYIQPVFILSGVISIFNLTSLLIEHHKIRPNSFLSGASFFVFACHGVYILQKTDGYYKEFFSQESTFGLLLRYFLVPIICIIICLVIYQTLKIMAPRFLAILTGNR